MLEIDSMVQVYKGCHAVSVATAQARRTNMSARSLIGILTPIAAIVVLSSANARHAIAGPQDSLLERDSGAVIVNVLSAWQRADARGIAAQYEQALRALRNSSGSLA
jgi:hypothetical protein